MSAVLTAAISWRRSFFRCSSFALFAVKTAPAATTMPRLPGPIREPG